MLKKQSVLIAVILILIITALSCSGIPVSESMIISSYDEGKNALSINDSEFPEIETISVLCDAEELRIVCRNFEKDRNGRLVSIEWDGDKTESPCTTRLYKNENNLIIILKSPPGHLQNSGEKIMTLHIAENLGILRFDNISKSSSTDLRLTGIDIDRININTSGGSNYVELADCSTDIIHINSDYGRSFIMLTQSEVNSELILSGSPDESKVHYFDKTAGAVHAELIGCSLNGSFKINSSTGKIEVYAENTVFKGSVGSISNRGMHFYDLWDCSMQTEGPISVVSDSGKIYFKWARHEPNRKDFVIDLKTRSEEIYFRSWGPLELFRYDISTETQTGEKEFHSYEVFKTLEEGRHYRSINFSEPLDLITVRAETESGKIYTRVVDCYKKLRFCGDFKTMRPLEPPF